MINISESFLKLDFSAVDSELTKLIPELKKNDKELLADISNSIIRLNEYQFQKSFEILHFNLLDRVQDFDEDNFTITRFDGWCSAINNLAGMYCYANQRFLEQKGLIFPDEYYDDLDGILKLGIESLIEKQGSVRNLAEWQKIDESYYKSSRKSLANALNYLAREAYVYSRSSFKDGYSLFLNRYDILAHSYTFASISIVDEDDQHLKNLYKIHDDIKVYLLNKSNQIVGKGLFIQNQDMFFKKLFYVFVNLSVKLFRTNDVVRFKDWFYIPTANAPFNIDITPLLPVIFNHIQEFPFFHERFSKVIEIESISMRLLKIKYKIDTGQPVDINIEQFLLGKFNNMHLGDIYNLLNILAFVSLKEKTKILPLIKRRMSNLKYSDGHNINYLARVIQLQNTENDIENQKVLNEAYAISLSGFDSEVSNCDDSVCIENNNVVLFALNQCRITAPMISGISKILYDSNYKFFNLEEHYQISHTVPKWPFSVRLSSDFMSCVGFPSEPKELLNKGWLVDPENSILQLDGINYYQGMYERVSRVLKVFNVPWQLPAAKIYFNMWLIQIDRVIHALKEVRKVAIERKLKIILVSTQAHFVPWFALKTFAVNHSNEFSHVTLSSSYENWKSNVGGEPLSTLTFMNNSQQAYPSIPAFGSYSSFETWYKDYYITFKDYWDAERVVLTSMKRSGTVEPNSKTDELYLRLKVAKASGKKIFCAIGKIPYDLAVPYQGGPAHNDMGDWLNHTVETIEHSDNLLLVKPHPHELKTEISGKPIEGFLDMIKNKDSLRNTVLLPHLGVNLQDLFEYVDVFICWNGSSIAELGAQGRRVIACDDWAKHNYPIDVYLPKNRPHYCNILEGKVDVKMSSEFFEKSEAYTVYLTQAPFALRYKFATRSSTNIRFNEAKIQLKAFNEIGFQKLAVRSSEILQSFS